MTRSRFFALSFATLAASTAALAQSTATQLVATTTPVAAAVAPSAPGIVITPAIKPVAAAEVPTSKAADVETKSVAATEATAEKPDSVAAAPTPPPAPVISLVAKVDLSAQRVTILEHGKPKFTWTISSGARGYETPRGVFQPGWMAKEWFSKQYDNAPMPHAVFFKDGAAMHATQAIGSLGRPASHGCVRLAPSNAATFYALVQRHGLKHTRVHVFGAPKFAPEAVASRRAPSGYQGRGYQQVAYAPRPAQGYASFSGNNVSSGWGGSNVGYIGHGYYANGNNGSAFQQRAQQVRVVPYNGGRRY